MRKRCLSESNKDYPNYGGRGIGICPEWDSYVQFRNDMGYRPEGTTLERVDRNRGYSPDNCVWADMLTQNNNRSCSTGGLKQLAEANGLAYETVYRRWKKGERGDKLIRKSLRK